jgi:hypothetical protein
LDGKESARELGIVVELRYRRDFVGVKIDRCISLILLALTNPACIKLFFLADIPGS